MLEFAGIGPGPFCGMMLADMGADVILVERPAIVAKRPTLLDLGKYTVTHRGKRSVTLDLKMPEALQAALRLVAGADALIEGFRPGVMERIGLGPEVCLERNPRLVYGRMTGWGQDGPLAQAAGHDINYLALTGLLALGKKGADGEPWVPPTVLGDMAGGAMFLAFGLVCGLLETSRSRAGQVVDAAITDGAALLGSLIHGVQAAGLWSRNVLDGNSHFYNVFQCADGRWISLGAIEPQFYAVLKEKMRLDGPEWDSQYEAGNWPALREKLARIFAAGTLQEWCALLEGSDACVSPVMELDAAALHPHNVARGTFIMVDGIVQPAPAPRFSRTPGTIDAPPPVRGGDSDAVLREWGIGEEELHHLRQIGALGT